MSEGDDPAATGGRPDETSDTASETGGEGARAYPQGFDPARDVMLDARSLRGMAHPLRPQILGLLRAEGPLTATRLAERLGQSSAATSYHLRQLAAYGFIEEDEGRGTTRERWWRARHRTTWFDTAIARAPDSDVDPGELGVLADDYLHQISDLYATKVRRWLDHYSAEPREWVDASTMSDRTLRLTAEESRQLHEEIKAVVERYRDASADDAPADARLVSAQYQEIGRAHV